MSDQLSALNRKIVIVLAEALGAPQAANTSALLALTVGARYPGIIGSDIPDADGVVHSGISGVPVPVLSAPQDRVAEFARASEPVYAVGFTNIAARARTYDEYMATMAQTPTSELEYLGVALIGPRKNINSLTGSLPLLR